MPCAAKFKPHNIPCYMPYCNRYFTMYAGLTNHMRTHSAHMRVEQCCWQQLGLGHDHNDNHDGDLDGNYNADTAMPKHPDDFNDVHEPKRGENVITHSHINGT